MGEALFILIQFPQIKRVKKSGRRPLFPAKAGIQGIGTDSRQKNRIPASAGMSGL